MLCLSPVTYSEEAAFASDRDLPYFSFAELRKLSVQEQSHFAFAGKLNTFFRSFILDNQYARMGMQPLQPLNMKLNTPVVRIASWNIEKSIQMKNAITVFSSAKDFLDLIDNERIPVGSSTYHTILRQQTRLADSDIIVLQEMEIGIKRSGYINAAGELAKKLQMNYTFAPQYLEVDPVILGIDPIYLDSGRIDKSATDYFKQDEKLYKGVFGSAVLSRYPIKRVEVFPLQNQPYDWYRSERKKTAYLEKARRISSDFIFRNEMTREIKIGGRHFFRVDLHVPELPDETLSIINVHLEIKCRPKERTAQLAELLSYIRHISHPVVLIGDFNAAPVDLSPTSMKRALKRSLKNPTTWLSAGITYFTPNGLLINTTRSLSNYTKNLDDPLALHIPIIAPNHLRAMFTLIRDFEFSDARRFDFRGDRMRSISGHAKILSNSNERNLKGFKTTFHLNRPIGPLIGHYKLDWAFVKSYLHRNKFNTDEYIFAPHYGETMTELNLGLRPPISDHDPIVIDLPLRETRITEYINP
jgi:endonuclease/exonuclease/phosphatase family metal-dependent hydrolase